MIQLQFINKLLSSKDSTLITLNNLTDEFFSDYKAEFNFIKSHLQQYGKIPDEVTFLNSFPDFELFKVEESDKYLLDTLYEDRNKRLLAKTFNKIRDALNSGNTEKAMQIYSESSEELVTAKHLESVDIFKDLSRYDAYVERSQDYGKFYVKTGFPELDEVIGGWDRREEYATIMARTNRGKCLAKGSKILMGDGTIKKVEDVRPGDKVQSLNRVNTVLTLHKGKSKGYKIIPNVGNPFIISENHILTLLRRKGVWDKVRKMSTTRHEYDLVDISIEEYLKLSKHQKKQLSLYRPGVDYETKEQNIPAYILGLWLGDGTSNRVELTSMDEELIKVWSDWALSLNLTCRKSKDTFIPSKERLSKAHSFEITAGKINSGKENIAQKLFREHNLFNNKHIPLNYLTGDKEQRLQLLAGILDTDGYYNGNGYELTLSNENLIQQVAQLARGLGFRVATVRKHLIKQFVEYSVNIYGPHLNDIPVILARKKAKIPTANMLQRELNLTGFKVEEVPEVEYYGFMADGDHRYLLADNTLTHNTWILLKTAIAAAQQGLTVGLYSGEMSENKVGYRIDTLLSHISNTKITHGNVGIQVDYKRFLENLSTSVKGTIKVLTPAMINGIAGVNALRSFIEKDHLDMLCIDQHSLLEDDRGARNPVERAANISKDLKNLQVLTKIPIITVSQQNREDTEEKGIDTRNIAQSDRIGQDSTVVIAIDRKDDVMILTLVKSRDSAVGSTLKYNVNLDTGTFTFIPSEEDATKGTHCEELKNEYEYSGDSYEENPF